MKRFFRHNGLSVVLGLLFLVTYLGGQLFSGWHVHNDERADRDEAPLSLSAYLVSAHFLETTSENWESEFLAIGSMVVLSIFLREKGSPESKPLEAPHAETGC